ncbi:Peptidyl-tRNA hydrolase [Candidatus Sumerlaea chitinivorans]|uniref:Peptidyl-tRNA hydrolase n=1 Tax=Sumerlaea chitinivorans TaxID=2250252 RepID=A0A2Z4Y817_SUMC1|nr:Peptidyl-tRNA hydrolase [Candidatus Sumerlaea chitinivorans]
MLIPLQFCGCTYPDVEDMHELIMKLVVGLGNPGSRYERTPHNVGFDVVDLLAKRHGGTWALRTRFEAAIAEIVLDGKRVTLLKPLTYMNLSGRAVQAYLSKEGGEPAELLVISDDIALPLGQLRIRPSGSHGGHKGLLSIIQSLGTLDFPRLRIGVRPNRPIEPDWVQFVLSHFPPEEWEVVRTAEETAADAIEMILERGLEAAMNRYNRKSTTQQGESGSEGA